MKKYSLKFWLTFWLISAAFLTGWFWFWEIHNRGITAVAPALDYLPIGNQQKENYKAATELGQYFLEKDGKEKKFLVLFQNNMEIRPGGGFIGAFGIIKMKDGQVVSVETHDLSNFDERITDVVKPPYPMGEILKINSWKLRDSNWSPDFSVNAKKAEEFYHMGQGQENFDGVIGITTNVLTSLLKVTGPVQIEGYPGTYDSENAILMLEYQVEKAFDEQGIERRERKSIMGDLSKEIIGRVQGLSIKQKMELADILFEDMKNKDIQLYFSDRKMQDVVESAGWAGRINNTWNKDYLMTVDANLGAYKSDYYMKRSLDYTIDLSKDAPVANLKITYQHTAKQRDWMTKDYLTYLRVYVPEDSWFVDGKNFDNVQFGDELENKYFGAIVRVPLDSTKTVEINYTLPKVIAEDYNLLIQKQAGLSGVPVSVHIIEKDGSKKDYELILNSDSILSESQR